MAVDELKSVHRFK